MSVLTLIFSIFFSHSVRMLGVQETHSADKDMRIKLMWRRVTYKNKLYTEKNDE